MRLEGSKSDCGHWGPLRQRRVPFWKASLLVAFLASLVGLAAVAMTGVRETDSEQLPDIMGTICRGSTNR